MLTTAGPVPPLIDLGAEPLRMLSGWSGRAGWSGPSIGTPGVGQMVRRPASLSDILLEQQAKSSQPSVFGGPLNPTIRHITFDCTGEPYELAQFWSALLGNPI